MALYVKRARLSTEKRLFRRGREASLIQQSNRYYLILDNPCPLTKKILVQTLVNITYLRVPETEWIKQGDSFAHNFYPHSFFGDICVYFVKERYNVIHFQLRTMKYPSVKIMTLAKCILEMQPRQHDYVGPTLANGWSVGRWLALAKQRWPNIGPMSTCHVHTLMPELSGNTTLAQHRANVGIS